MPIDPLVVIVVAVVALIVATTVAHRTGEHADRRAGRYHVAEAAHGTAAGPFGPVLDVLDRSVAAYTIRSALGLSTETRQERRIAIGNAAAATWPSRRVSPEAHRGLRDAGTTRRDGRRRAAVDGVGRAARSRPRARRRDRHRDRHLAARERRERRGPGRDRRPGHRHALADAEPIGLRRGRAELTLADGPTLAAATLPLP
jgi:hypothetical protein